MSVFKKFKLKRNFARWVDGITYGSTVLGLFLTAPTALSYNGVDWWSFILGRSKRHFRPIFFFHVWKLWMNVKYAFRNIFQRPIVSFLLFFHLNIYHILETGRDKMWKVFLWESFSSYWLTSRQNIKYLLYFTSKKTVIIIAELSLNVSNIGGWGYIFCTLIH